MHHLNFLKNRCITMPFIFAIQSFIVQKCPFIIRNAQFEFQKSSWFPPLPLTDTSLDDKTQRLVKVFQSQNSSLGTKIFKASVRD